MFGRTAATLGIAFLLLQTVALAVVFYVTLTPMAERSADDLAALIVLSAQTWVELPPETRPAFEQELATHHQLRISNIEQQSDDEAMQFFDSRNIEQALSRRTGQDIRLQEGQDGWVWVKLQMGGHLIHVGFEERHYYVRALMTAVGLISLAALLTWVTSLVLVRRISKRLEQLSLAAVEVGQGQVPAPLPEDGASELARLGMAFNRMANEVQALLANRTTLLAGISHDLRTPIARMRLALAMLPVDTDSQLIQQIEHDLEQMNHLIGSFLDMARGMGSESPQAVNLAAVLEQLAEDARRGGGQVFCEITEPCQASVALHALQRIVMNLIENALRYGHADNQPSEVTLLCLQHEGRVLIQVLDRGPGIPPKQMEAVFRPFYRLEQSRNQATGGTGLGLAIARQLAMVNNWQLTLAARDGGGLVATLQL